MDFTNLINIVKTVSPLLGAVLPIPGGAAIGALIAHAFGGDSNNPDQLASLISNDSQAKVKLLEIETNCKVQLQQLMVQSAQNELTAHTAEIESNRLDRADARKNNSASYMPSIITFIIIVGFFVCFYLILKTKADASLQQVLFMMLGTISTSFGGAVSYWLGSSSGSKSKDEAIHKTLANLSGS